MTTEEHKEAVYQSCEGNSIWLNAFSCINPTDDYLRQLGRDILRMLGGRAYTIDSKPFEHDDAASEQYNKANQSLCQQPALFIKITKS